MTPPGQPAPHAAQDAILAEVEAARGELVELTQALIRHPTVNPPGEAYPPCAEAIGARLAASGFAVEYHVPEDHPDHSDAHPRVNVIGVRQGRSARPLLHLNGHFDVVPAGAGWTVDPFGGLVRDGRIYGRGACDMKAGIAAAIVAADAVRRAGVTLRGTLEISGTVDEESGGFAGVAWLAERGRLAASRTDYVIIPEPLDVDRVCVGHRGVYWFEVTARGRVAHGSMPFLGHSAIDGLGDLLHLVDTELRPRLRERSTALPVVPPGARHPTINVNAILGGQAGANPQTPCVADHCSATFDRRFLVEEGFAATKREVEALIAQAEAGREGVALALADLMVVHPSQTPADSPLVATLERRVRDVLGREATRVASPGTYDHKHVARIAGVEHCVAYGPGRLELAHQPDEYCDIDELVAATKVLALAIVDLIG